MESKSASSFVVAPRCKKRFSLKKTEKLPDKTLKIQKKNLNQVGHQKTSTPLGPVRFRRLSETFQKLNLSPVLPPVMPDSDDNEGPHKEDKVEVEVPSKRNNPLGYPLLSSTKLDPSLDNDRLSNAVRLYRKQLERKGPIGRRILEKLESKKELEEHVTSQLFHKNAMINTFEES